MPEDARVLLQRGNAKLSLAHRGNWACLGELSSQQAVRVVLEANCFLYHLIIALRQLLLLPECVQSVQLICILKHGVVGVRNATIPQVYFQGCRDQCI